ncbi:aconitate hydratase [bacterium]|nr:aconitate hydratase [bacterium]
MSKNLIQKIIQKHIIEGEMVAGSPISILIDQTLTQDATGTMAYLQFEALGLKRVKTELSVSYVDHNTLQSGFENADDHRFLQSVASKFGIYFSRPGNGVCHQVHLERFGVPGKTLLGSDSHTPTCGGLGMLAIGAGGLDVALAMAGQPFHMKMPSVVQIHLTGKLNPFVSAKDVILEILRRLTVKGGVGKVMEYTGEGVKTLSVPERATIANMGAELGATSSVFPSDEQTHEFLRSQGREGSWIAIEADFNASYDEKLDIDLSLLEPMIAKPHMPDNVCKVREIEGMTVDQVAIGSCTNSSYQDLMTVAHMLKGRKIHPDVTVAIAPGSRQVLLNLVKNRTWELLLESGIRVLENVCGPCIGMGFAPNSEAVTLRTFNRNFLGRSGTKSAKVYLCSPETAIAAALTGKITDPRELGLTACPHQMPELFFIDDSMILKPADYPDQIEIKRGPNIQPLPMQSALPAKLTGRVLLKVKDDITTDHIMPAGAKILPLRSNIPAISEYVFSVIDPEFPKRAKKAGSGFLVGGLNYGQGSSREHAALAPMYLGIRAVIVQSFSRIHLANLINFGIVPLVFENTEDYHNIDQEDELEIDVSHLEQTPILIVNKTKGVEIKAMHSMSKRDLQLIRAGGSLSYTKKILNGS